MSTYGCLNTNHGKLYISVMLSGYLAGGKPAMPPSAMTKFAHFYLPKHQNLCKILQKSLGFWGLCLLDFLLPLFKSTYATNNAGFVKTSLLNMIQNVIKKERDLVASVVETACSSSSHPADDRETFLILEKPFPEDPGN